MRTASLLENKRRVTTMESCSLPWRAGDLKEFTTRWRQALYTDVLGAFVKGGTGVVGAIEGAQTRRPHLSC